ncbi:MAG: hypothetical protein RLY23_1445 [Actinomycetota bacterium]
MPQKPSEIGAEGTHSDGTVPAMKHSEPTKSGILAGPVDGAARIAAAYPAIDATPGIKLLHRSSGFIGTLLRLDPKEVILRTPTGAERRFKNIPGAFSHGGNAVRLSPVVVEAINSGPNSGPNSGTSAESPDLRGGRIENSTTASGSRSVAGAKARTARSSRILVEGIHDAELIERVWGDDLRLEGIVVERLDGIDDLAAVVSDFSPGKTRRLGILVDHLVPGSKESRIAAEIVNPYVLITGTPYVDVWEAVRPSSVGIASWPQIPKGVSWKEGICSALGEPDPREMWRRILGSVKGWSDLEQPLVLAVETLIDFVTVTP